MDGSFNLLTQVDPLLLPAYSKPLPDELLSSWLTRMARDHGLHIFEFCNLCWPKVALFERDIDRNGKDAVLGSIARRTNCCLEEVKTTTLRYFEHKLYDPSVKKDYGRTKWMLPIGRESFKHKKKGLLFCPCCLQRDAENPYYRKKWRLALSFACVDCGCHLQDCCPWCDAPICFFRNAIGLVNQATFKNWVVCSNCKRDLRESKTKPASEEHTQVQRHLYEILQYGYSSNVMYPILYFDVLHQIIQLLITCRPRLQSLRRDLFEQQKMPFFILSSSIPIFELLDSEMRMQVTLMAYWLLSEWPERFLFYCKKHELRSTDVLPRFKNAPFWYEGTILQEIYRPRNTQSEVPFGLYSIFGCTDRQSGYHRRRIQL